MNGDDKKPIMLPVSATMAAGEPVRSPTTLPPEIQDAAAERRREQQEREAAEREAWASAEQERRAIAMYDADARRRRGDGNVSFGQGVATVGAATAIGTAAAGPVGALLGAGVGWLIDHIIQGR